MTNASRHRWIDMLRDIIDARTVDAGALRDGSMPANLLPHLGKAIMSDLGQLRALANDLRRDAIVARDAGRKAGRPRRVSEM